MRRDGSPTRRADGSSGNSTSRMRACVTRSRVQLAKRSVKLSAPRYVHIVGCGRQVITKDWARYYGERQVVLGAKRDRTVADRRRGFSPAPRECGERATR